MCKFRPNGHHSIGSLNRYLMDFFHTLMYYFLASMQSIYHWIRKVQRLAESTCVSVCPDVFNKLLHKSSRNLHQKRWWEIHIKIGNCKGRLGSAYKKYKWEREVIQWCKSGSEREGTNLDTGRFVQLVRFHVHDITCLTIDTPWMFSIHMFCLNNKG